jgi:hypothetical protein
MCPCRAAPLKGKTKMHFTSSDQYPECRRVYTGQKAEIDCVAKLFLRLHNLAVLQACHCTRTIGESCVFVDRERHAPQT